MRMIDVQKLHQRHRVTQVDPQEEVQNQTLQLATATGLEPTTT